MSTTTTVASTSSSTTEAIVTALSAPVSTTTSQTSPPPQPVALQPASVSASNTRPGTELRCGGTNSFLPEFLIDGDPQTGWGASSGDGTGQSITIDFGREVRLTEIGLTPGYLRVAPRKDQECRAVSAFRFNRLVTKVAYWFDDGSRILRSFDDAEEMQWRPVGDVLTSQVTIEIVETIRPGTDNDTILSDVAFRGHEQ